MVLEMYLSEIIGFHIKSFSFKQRVYKNSTKMVKTIKILDWIF